MTSRRDSDSQALWGRVRRRPGASAVASLLLLVAVLVAVGIVATDAAVVAIILLLLALLILASEGRDARDLIGRLTKVSAAGMSFEFSPKALSEAATARRETVDQEEQNEPNAEKESVEQDSGSAAEQLVELRLSLDQKLTYLAKHVLGAPVNGKEQPTFVTIGSLQYDKYLSEAQARTLMRLLMLSNFEAGRPEVAAFIDDASRVVRNLRATVFQRLVGKVAADCGWKRVRTISKPGRRLLVVTKGKTELRLAPVWAVGTNRGKIDAALERLRSRREVTLVVVPNQSRVTFSHEPPRPNVVSLSNLPVTLAELET